MGKSQGKSKKIYLDKSLTYKSLHITILQTGQRRLMIKKDVISDIIVMFLVLRQDYTLSEALLT